MYILTTFLSKIRIYSVLILNVTACETVCYVIVTFCFAECNKRDFFMFKDCTFKKLEKTVDIFNFAAFGLYK